MQSPQIAILISTYQRPDHLRRCLLAIALQRDVEGRFELIVTDDGSTDETAEVVREFGKGADFPVKFTTHRHDGFQVARCRNEGVAVSHAPYLLFSDGDCVFPADHVAAHLAFRRRGTVAAGDCYRLDQATSRRVTEEAIRSGQFLRLVPPRERHRIANKARRGRAYSLLRCRMRPRLTGANFSLWRDDYERVNGFDQTFVGWGLEDYDLQQRLGRQGIRFRSILHHTVACHLWHPQHPTFSRNGEGTPNLHYFSRRGRLTRCRNGLAKRELGDVAIRTINQPPRILRHEAFAGRAHAVPHERPEVEVLFLPGEGRFSGRADCNVLVLAEDCPVKMALLRQAHIVITDRDDLPVLPELRFPLRAFSAGLKAVA